jgi:hypothetical protein
MAVTLWETKSCDLHTTLEILKQTDNALFDVVLSNVTWDRNSPELPQETTGWPLYTVTLPDTAFLQNFVYHKNLPSVGNAPYLYINYDSKQQSWAAGQGQCVASWESPFNVVEMPPAGVTKPVPRNRITRPPSTFAPTAPLPKVYPQGWAGIGVGVAVGVTLVVLLCLFGGEEEEVAYKPAETKYNIEF